MPEAAYVETTKASLRPDWQADFRVASWPLRPTSRRSKRTEQWYPGPEVGGSASLSQAQLAVALIALERWDDAIRELEPLIKAEPERLIFIPIMPSPCFGSIASRRHYQLAIAALSCWRS